MSFSTPSLRTTAALFIPLFLALPACSGGSGGETDSTGTDGTTTENEPTGGAAVEEPPGEVVKSDRARVTSPDISTQEMATMSDDERAFALSLFAALPEKETNVAISPTSIRAAFGQTYAGTRTISKTEIEAALKFGPDPAKTHAGLNNIDLELEARNLPASGELEGDDSVVVRFVNQVFGQQGVTWEPGFLDILAENYGKSMHTLDFADAEPSRLLINDWVKGVTGGKISELLPKDSIDDSVTTVLVNALYLKAPWRAAFEFVDESGDFKLIDGSSITTTMISGMQEAASYVAGEGYEAAELPMRGDELSMVIIVPEAGTFKQFASDLDGAALGEIFAGLVPTSLSVTMPRFKFSSDLFLNEALKTLGILSTFELGSGDFSGMSPAGLGWFISGVYHDVFIAVDEKGVEAAAATAVVVNDSGGPVVDNSLTADRPFLFAIRDRGTDSLLFFGQVVDPSK